METNLTPRQWALKRFLENNFLPHKFFSIEEICEKVVMPNGEKAYTLNTNPYNHDKCVALSNDVRTINWSLTEGYKILIKDSNGGVKLCESEQEFLNWRDSEMKPILRKFQYLNNLKYKAERDGTMPLINQANNPIDYEHKQVEPVEVYQKEENKPFVDHRDEDNYGVDIWGNEVIVK